MSKKSLSFNFSQFDFQNHSNSSFPGNNFVQLHSKKLIKSLYCQKIFLIGQKLLLIFVKKKPSQLKYLKIQNRWSSGLSYNPLLTKFRKQWSFFVCMAKKLSIHIAISLNSAKTKSRVFFKHVCDSCCNLGTSRLCRAINLCIRRNLEKFRLQKNPSAQHSSLSFAFLYVYIRISIVFIVIASIDIYMSEKKPHLHNKRFYRTL